MYLFLNLVVFTLFGLVPAVALSALAGRWDLWNVWATAGIFIAWLNFQTLVASWKSPGLLKERLTPGPGGRVRCNPFFSPEVRIQADRGQRVIQKGPYAIVRHPGYATILLAMLVSGLALNSLLALIPAVLYAAVTVRVTAIEDRMLQAELTGYADYAARVPYRLVPGLW